MSLSNLLEELTNVLFGELKRDLLTRIAFRNERLVVLVLFYELVRHVAPHDLEQATVLDQMLLDSIVQVVEAFLDLARRILAYDLAQIVRRQLELVRDVLGLVATFDFRVHFLKKALKKSF